MNQIRITIDGQPKNLPVAWLDWDAAYASGLEYRDYGINPTVIAALPAAQQSKDRSLCIGVFSAGGRDAWQSGSLPRYLAGVQRHSIISGFGASGSHIKETFGQGLTYSVPPGDLNDPIRRHFTQWSADPTIELQYWMFPSSTWDPTKVLYTPDYGTVNFSGQTANGGTVDGAISLCRSSAVNMVDLPLLARSCAGYWQGGTGTSYRQDDYFGCVFDGEYCITENSTGGENPLTGTVISNTFGTLVPWEVGTKLDPVTPDDVDLMMVATQYNGVLYIGCAALSFTGDNVSGISCTMMPDWYWGDYEITPTGSDVELTEGYFGFDADGGGGDGTYSYTVDQIGIPTAVNPYSNIAADGHGLHVYAISESVFGQCMDTLWGAGNLALALWNKFKNYRYNPIGSIVGCHRLPADLMPTLTTQVPVRAGGCAITSGSDAYYANGSTTVDHTVGSLNVDKYFGSFMDYDPFTAVKLFLPFCGWVEIPADRCRGGSISVKYRCDIVTGNVCAYIGLTDQTGKQTEQLTATGNAALTIPLTGNDQGTGAVVGAITAAAGIAVGALTGGVGTAAMLGGAAAAGMGVNAAKHITQQASQYSGSVASISQLQCFAMVTMPIEHSSDLERQLNGIKSGRPIDQISRLKGAGFVSFRAFHPDIDCTEPEQEEIERLMKEGVIL